MDGFALTDSLNTKTAGIDMSPDLFAPLCIKLFPHVCNMTINITTIRHLLLPDTAAATAAAVSLHKTTHPEVARRCMFFESRLSPSQQSGFGSRCNAFSLRERLFVPAVFWLDGYVPV